MPQLAPIHLDSQWFYALSDDASLVKGRAPNLRDWRALDSLGAWRSISLDSAPYLWLYHPIRLQPLGMCAVYFLHVDAVPSAAQFFINGKAAGKHDARKGIFATDVTHLIDLEPGGVAIRLETRKIISDQLRGIRIQPIPCDEI